MNPAGISTIDYQAIAIALGYLLMGVLSFFGAILWNDVRALKEKGITRQEFKDEMQLSTSERDKKHQETTGNLHRLDEKLDRLDHLYHDSAVAIEKRIGQVLLQIERIRPPSAPRNDGPERRRY